jgi:hypothetical protein
MIDDSPECDLHADRELTEEELHYEVLKQNSNNNNKDTGLCNLSTEYLKAHTI